MPASWRQVKECIDRQLEEQGFDDSVTVDWIDISYPDVDDPGTWGFPDTRVSNTGMVVD